MNRLFCLIITILLSSQFGNAQDTTDSLGWDISGSLDVYYRANLQGDHEIAPATSFANLPGFSLGMVNLTIGNEGKKVGFTSDLVVGPRGEDATFLSPALRPGGSSNLINQLFVYWKVSKDLKLTLGNFNTFLGYEVISPASNFNYSTSYLFSYGPFSHTGLKMDYANDNGMSAMVGLFNPTDATEFNPSNDYTLGTQLGYAFGTGSVFLNGVFSEDFYQLDITAGVDLSDKVYVGLNASTAKDAFTGVAAYLKFTSSDKLSLGTRFEYFKDEGLELFGSDNGSVIDLSLSANYTIGKLTLIPELRVDKSSEDVFSDDNKMKNTLSSFVLGAVYAF